MNIQLLPTEAHPVRGRNSLNAPKDKRLMNSKLQSNQQGPASSSSSSNQPDQRETSGSSAYQNRTD